MLSQYILKEKTKILITGRSIGQRIGSGKAKIINDPRNMHQINEGDVLIADMTLKLGAGNEKSFGNSN